MANANFQVSSKLPDGRIFVIAADTSTEFKQNLAQILGDVGAESLITTMAQSIEGAPTSIDQAISNLATLGAKPISASTTAPSGRVCKHGDMTRRTGSGAKGPWKAFMCPSPKGTPDQCDPIWIRRNEPEWSTF